METRNFYEKVKKIFFVFLSYFRWHFLPSCLFVPHPDPSLLIMMIISFPLKLFTSFFLFWFFFSSHQQPIFSWTLCVSWYKNQKTKKHLLSFKLFVAHRNEFILLTLECWTRKKKRNPSFEIPSHEK